MKTLLEILIDDEGNIDLRSGNEHILDNYYSVNDPEKAKSFFRKVLSTMIDRMWKNRNTCISKAIRLLSMAEMCACAEPYAQAEEFWSTMMFSLIPKTKKYADSLKKKYGYDPDSKQRPITFGDVSAFRLDYHKGLS